MYFIIVCKLYNKSKYILVYFKRAYNYKKYKIKKYKLFIFLKIEKL